ncbi:DUF1345 domain-containing protein [Arvimicrobium flavum]|uniref:DUF1345 domain-containing protein n=1 Tax=Arvimicrobium flavum TaxID=3393320 RepID=UPI00237C30D5|nr:DUF1345 domain-containing protein [Mesorhizobium shangrilense]
MNGRPTRHRAFAIAAVLGLLTFGTSFALSLPQPYTLAANVYFLAYSTLVLIEMSKMSVHYLRTNARREDLPVLAIFALTLLVVAAAIAALFNLINAARCPSILELVVSLASIPLGWFTIQAMTAVHYAHLYWVRDEAAEEDGPGSRRAGGLEFPGKAAPVGFDFLYFAATVGMTAQTADTAITSSDMRRMVLMHAIVSFFFNTIIVAAAVNLAVSRGDCEPQASAGAYIVGIVASATPVRLSGCR